MPPKAQQQPGKGSWSQEEERKMLIALFEKHEGAPNYEEMASVLEGRTPKACKEHILTLRKAAGKVGNKEGSPKKDSTPTSAKPVAGSDKTTWEMDDVQAEIVKPARKKATPRKPKVVIPSEDGHTTGKEDAVATPTPKAKKRASLKKDLTGNDAVAATLENGNDTEPEINGAVAAPESKTAPKKRTSPQNEAAAADTSSDKNHAATEDELNDTATVSELKATPKKRATPKKKGTAAGAVAVTSEEGQNAGAGADVAATTAETKSTPKKRGAPKKKPVTTNAVASTSGNEDDVEADNNAAAPTPEHKATPKRASPKKKDATTPTPKRKRATKDTTAAVVGSEHEEAGETENDQKSDSPAKKTKADRETSEGKAIEQDYDMVNGQDFEVVEGAEGAEELVEMSFEPTALAI